MIEIYKLLGIILVITGAVDMIILPRIIARAKGDANTPIVTAAIWVMALATMIAGGLCFFGVFGTF
jgi:hypothetical protein